MKKLMLFFAVALGLSLSAQSEKDYQVKAQELIDLSKNFLQSQKDKDLKKADQYALQYTTLDEKTLKKALNTDTKKLTFWINTYNGFIQYLLTKDPDLYKDRGEFFSEERVVIGNEKVSFDDLEHGILRRGTNKFSGGYVKNIFAYGWADDFEVDVIDWRIHFALNCGAKSCPMVRIYDDETLSEQLNASTKEYLKSQVKYDKEEGVVNSPALMLWFRGDFDGVSGCKKILKDFGFVPKDADISLDYNDYDWTLALGTFY